MSGNECEQIVKEMDCEIEKQTECNEETTNADQSVQKLTGNINDDGNVPEIMNTISDIVDPNLNVTTDPSDDGLINEIAKKAENEDRMTFCIERPAETLLPVVSSSRKEEEILVVHPVFAFARPVNMEYTLVEEKDVMSELAKEAELLVNETEKSASEKVSTTVDESSEQLGGVPKSEASDVSKSTEEGGISSVVEQVVRRSQRVYNSLVGPDSAVKVVAPIPLYRKSARLSDASLTRGIKKEDVVPKQITALRGKKSKLKSTRKSPPNKMELTRRTPRRIESMKMCNPSTNRVSKSASTSSNVGKDLKKLPKFLSRFGVKSNAEKKNEKEVNKPQSRKRTSSDLQEQEDSRSSTPNKPIQKSASTASLIRKLKMRDGGELPTPRRSQRIYNSLNGPKEAVSVMAPTTRDLRPTNEVVYNSLVGEDNDVKLEIPKIRKRTIKKSRPEELSKKAKVSKDEITKPSKHNQGYSKFDRLLMNETNPGRPVGVLNEFTQTADTNYTPYSRSKARQAQKEQKNSDNKRVNSKSENTSETSPSVTGASETSVLVASSYFTTRRGTQTKVVYSTPATLSSSTASQKRPAMSTSVQRNSPGLRQQRLGLAPDRPCSSRSSTGTERSLRSRRAAESSKNDSDEMLKVSIYINIRQNGENFSNTFLCTSPEKVWNGYTYDLNL